jgi:AraC-like DNA-binding protein
MPGERRSAQVSGGHGEKFSRLQQQACAALLLHNTISAAASHAGIAESTLRRWMQDPGFAALYESFKDQALSMASRMLHSHSVQAASLLVDIMGDDQAGYGHRISAARTVLEMTLRPRAEKSESQPATPKLVEFETRISLLEKAFNTPLILLRSDGTTRRLNNTEANVSQATLQLTADAE